MCTFHGQRVVMEVSAVEKNAERPRSAAKIRILFSKNL